MSNSNNPLAPAATDLADGKFVLTRAHWTDIQIFVEECLSLPTSLEDYQRSLGGLPAYPDMNTATVDLYLQLNLHATQWKNETYHHVVDLADDLVAYARKNETTWNKIANDDAFAAKMTGPRWIKLIDRLQTDAAKFEARARTVMGEVQAFKAALEDSKRALDLLELTYDENLESLRADNKADINRIGTLRSRIDIYNNQIKEQIEKIDEAVYYAWVPIAGAIAAIVVVTGANSKIDELTDQIKSARTEIGTLSAESRRDVAYLSWIELSKQRLGALDGMLDSAITGLAAVQGFWGAVAGDLKAAKEQATAAAASATDDDEDFFFSSLDMMTAVEAWRDVKAKADHFRQVAFIEVREFAAAA